MRAHSTPDIALSQILNDDDQLTLLALRQYDRSSCFIVGDMRNKYIYANAQQNERVTQNMVERAIGNLVGKSARSIQAYGEVAAFFPDDVRQTYGDLPFSYFTLAKRMDQRWQEVLEYAVANPQMGLDALRVRFLLDMDTPPISSDYSQELFGVDETGYKRIASPTLANFAKHSLIALLGEMVDKCERLITSRDVGISKKTLEKIMVVLDSLRDLLPVVVDEIKINDGE